MLIHVLYEEWKMYCYSSVAEEDMSRTCSALWNEIKDLFSPLGKSEGAFEDVVVQRVILPYQVKSNDDVMDPTWCMFFMHCSVHSIPFCAITSAKKDLVDLRLAITWSMVMNQSSLSAGNQKSEPKAGGTPATPHGTPAETPAKTPKPTVSVVFV
jgi:hypothetical protein